MVSYLLISMLPLFLVEAACKEANCDGFIRKMETSLAEAALNSARTLITIVGFEPICGSHPTILLKRI